jgi:diguanylate cyclase (GGDEF)-like protein
MLPKILIVDDESATREALKRTLRADFEISEASSADEALTILKTDSSFAVILTDEKMPHKTGTALLSEVKILHPRLARVMISGQMQLDQMMVAINNAEVHRFILKPWENEILRLQLQEALLFHHSLDEIIRLEKLSITDPVTGLTNHRYFQEKLKAEVERSNRHQRFFSVMMIDVDHFKKFNDRFGHPEGDKALAQVARLVKNATRTADSVSRYGGEEFTVILPETPKSSAMEVAGRIRKDLENIAIGASPENTLPITLSIGVACFPEDGLTNEELLVAADQALYKAKKDGRNCVVSYTQDLQLKK